MLGFFWGKTDLEEEESWHPLLLHLIDVAASAEAILFRESQATRKRIAEVLGLSWEEALPWLRLVIACHDIGKVCPGFQCKWKNAHILLRNAGVQIPKDPETSVKHGFVTQVALEELLLSKGWPLDLSQKIADAVGCHHGERASPTYLEHIGGDRKSIGDCSWVKRRREIFETLFDLFKPMAVPTKSKITGPDFMLFAGLTSFADWIGSNEHWFPFGTVDDTYDLSRWWYLRRSMAESALGKLGWEERGPLSKATISFEEVFLQKPRPLQEAIARAVSEITQPGIILIEAPMGEGKTEASFYGYLELQRRFGHRGLYIALPTKATGNAMFKRTLEFLRLQGSEKPLDLQLIHGATYLNDDFQKLRLTSIGDTDTQGGVRAAEWFTHKKRALLSEYGVGTVDQALLSILPVKHQFVRLWGLANRVVVFDEIHAYDTYTGTLLIELIRWLVNLGSSVILLSATLPPKFRNKLTDIIGGANLLGQDVPYPRISVYQDNKAQQISFSADPSRKRELKIEAVSEDLIDLKNAMDEKQVMGGLGLILVNTVQRAQDLYQLYGSGSQIEVSGHIVGKRLADNTEVYLFHARFPADQRQSREDCILSVFGKDGSREGIKILIATQVVEQSLDLDFDCLATDLAPIDLVLQRAGRLWRHQRNERPIADPVLLIAGLKNDEPPVFTKPLWWSAVYREDILLYTWILLKKKTTLVLPDEIDDLVKSVYEEQISIPDYLKDRLEKSQIDGEGEGYAQSNQAHSAFIGFPDDSSWDNPERFLKSDDDEAGLHPSLIAQTRLGEPSVMVVPVFSDEVFVTTEKLTTEMTKSLFLRSMSISRKGVVKKIHNLGSPENWQKASLLRNCYPLQLDLNGYWIEDPSVRLDNQLGLVFLSKEGK